MDNQARLLLPQILRNSARLDAEVAVFGMRTYLEVHNREIFESNLAANELTAEDRKAMAEILAARSAWSVTGPHCPIHTPQGERMTKQSERHVPVLLQDAIEFLNVRAGSVIADCTLGLAGHAAEIVRRLGPHGHLIGFDRDPEALELANVRLDTVAAELGTRRRNITLIGEAFSSISRSRKASFTRRFAGRLRRQQPAS